MADNNPEVIDNGNNVPEHVDEKALNGIMAELKAERKKRQEYEAKLKAKDEAELLEQGKLKELLQAREKEIELLKPRLVLAEEYETLLKTEREEIKAKLADNWDDSFNSLPLPALRKMVKTFTLPDKVLDTETGKKKDKEKNNELEQRLAEAYKKGNTAEVIAIKRMLNENK